MSMSCEEEESSRWSRLEVLSPSELDRPLLVPKRQDSSPRAAIFTDVTVIPEHDKIQLNQSILKLDGEVALLKKKEMELVNSRVKALDKLLDFKGCIRVMCRVRPFLLTDKRRINEPIKTQPDKLVVRSRTIMKEFKFDKIFNQATSQDDIFVEIDPVLRSALDGHNVSVLAYGQTGTGKTFTMDGTSTQPGIIPRALEELFRQKSMETSHDVKFSISMLEVYMGNLKDLLAPRSRAQDSIMKCPLNIQTDQKGFVEVEGLTEMEIPYLAKAKWWYAKGRQARSTSWTNVNETSSRSHCLTRITIFRNSGDLKAKHEISKLWMVDLGGSERLLKTGASGLTLDEGRAINLSLTSLGDVIAALRKKKSHVPYRNSKLTQILKDSLGLGSKVLMIVHISPSENDIGESLCSLSFAHRARALETCGSLSETITKQKLEKLAELEHDVREAEEECQKVRNQLRQAELRLSENKRIISFSPQISTEHQEDQEATYSPQIPQIVERISRRIITCSLPRFMSSTVASRQRRSAAEREIVVIARTSKSGRATSTLLSASMSLGYPDTRGRGILCDANRRSPHEEAKSFLTQGTECSGVDPNSASATKKRLAAASNSNLKTPIGRHRRRVSSLI